MTLNSPGKVDDVNGLMEKHERMMHQTNCGDGPLTPPASGKVWGNQSDLYL